jgi:hypothetical protein
MKILCLKLTGGLHHDKTAFHLTLLPTTHIRQIDNNAPRRFIHGGYLDVDQMNPGKVIDPNGILLATIPRRITISDAVQFAFTSGSTTRTGIAGAAVFSDAPSSVSS